MSQDRESERSSGFWTRVAGIPARRRVKWLILGLWIVILGIASPFASQLSDVETNDNTAFLPENAESLEAERLLEEFDNGDAIPAVVVYERPGGLTDADFERIESDRQELAEEFPPQAADPVSTGGMARDLSHRFWKLHGPSL